MWKALGEGVLRYRFALLAILLVATGFMAWQASKVKLSYEFSRAIPTDNEKYIAYQSFKKQFGEDGNMLVIGIQTNKIFEASLYNDYAALHQQLKIIGGVEDVISLPSAMNLKKNEITERLEAKPVFKLGALTQQEIDSSKNIFLSLPFYRDVLYNRESGAWLMGLRINNALLLTPQRTGVINEISRIANEFGAKHNIDMHFSGLPLIRTVLADRIARETKWFTLGSVLLSALILLIFFRSLSATALSLAVVIIGVIWSFGTIVLLGYKITILTALIAPLVVVIGIPNCIYFLNKYHTAYKDTGDQQKAIIQMVSKMGVVTLFCNIAAAIGFAVFALTKSAILKEFGLVAGINIMMLFFISLILIPAFLSVMGAPKERHVRYLENKRINSWLGKLEGWSLHNRKLIYGITGALLLVSLGGILRLKTVGYIVDDLPKTDKIYTDLKFFEQHFQGVMPLEILVDTKKKYGVSRNLNNLLRVDSLAQFLYAKPYIGKPLSIAEGLKFAKQAFFEGDSLNYSMPADYDLPALSQYLSMKSDSGAANSFTKLITSFTDSNRQQARISASMQDVGSAQLPLILDSVKRKADQLFDTSKYNVLLTGTSVTFLEGSRFIINGLKESIFWAFLLIALCMLYLFRSLRILICSLIPNLIPLVITAGVMGWSGIPLKPSTVLVFSVALGIAIDITIRFLVSYRQELQQAPGDVMKTVLSTIRSTGLSIIYTSIVLIAGFIIFCFSGFGGTQSLGWLTSLTLVVATITNLALLPALLIDLRKRK
ncbi:MAG TPA: MMPL family transporter [Chitinophagaceae bacterium]|nr:MMPL family transporter [Chitinophagaceae bacterium]